MLQLKRFAGWLVSPVWPIVGGKLVATTMHVCFFKCPGPLPTTTTALEVESDDACFPSPARAGKNGSKAARAKPVAVPEITWELYFSRWKRHRLERKNKALDDGAGSCLCESRRRVGTTGPVERVEWMGSGTLQASGEVTGPWEDLEGAITPQTITNDVMKRFFRLIAQ